MNYARRSLFSILLCALVLAGCSTSGGSGDPDPSGADLQGLVTGAGGAPVAGASVALFPAGEAAAPGTQRTTTDTRGAYAFDTVAAGTYNLVVTTSDGLGAFRANVTVAGSTPATQNVQVAPLGAIRGVAILEGRPSDSGGIEVSIPGTDFSAETDDDGAFLMSGVPAGTYELRAEAPGHDSATVTGVNVSAGATTVLPATITLQADNIAPTAAFTASLFGNVLTVDASGSTDPDGTIVSYEWNFGGGATSTGETAQHSYDTPGIKTVTLTVTDDGGLTDTESMQVTVEGSVEQVEANADPFVAVASPTLAAGATGYYEIEVSSTVAEAGAALFVELSEDLPLEVDWFGDIYYAESADFFSLEAMETGGSATLRPSGISVAQECGGSCVIVESDASFARVTITNTTGSSLTFDLFAYVDDLKDTNEPGNDSLAGAVPLGAGEFDSGAIELVGDVDYYMATDDAQVTFVGAINIDVIATVRNAADAIVGGPYLPGTPISVLSGQYIRVEAASDVAAVAGGSTYSLTLD